MRTLKLALSAALFVSLLHACSSKPKPSKETTVSQETKEVKPEAVPVPEDKPTTWVYDSSVNEMGDVSKFANIDANDLVYFDFPYGGGSQATITIRKKNNDLDILFIISKGQIDTDFNGTYTRVKFDEEKPKKYSMSEPSDGSTTVLFFNNQKALLEKIKKAKKMVVEVPFYQNGLQQFVFNVADLNWK